MSIVGKGRAVLLTWLSSLPVKVDDRGHGFKRGVTWDGRTETLDVYPGVKARKRIRIGEGGK